MIRREIYHLFRLVAVFGAIPIAGTSGFLSNPPGQYADDSRIVFLSNRDAPSPGFGIFVMNYDGSGQQNVMPTLRSVRSLSQPVLSPNGSKILFVSFHEEKPQLQLLDMKRRSVSNLTLLGHDDPQMSFSPSGDKILFVKKIDGRRQLHVINADGTAERNLSNNSSNEYDPVFSPDGTKVLFVSQPGEVGMLFVLNEDGSRTELSTEFGGHNRYPAFSPSGRLIAFVTESGPHSNVSVMRADGTDLESLTNGKFFDTRPQFSPDGSKVVFLSNRRGMKYSDLCIVNIDGTNLLNLTNGLNYVNQRPVFAPDGKSIIFDSVKFSDSEIYRVEIDGAGLKNLTKHPAWDQSPTLRSIPTPSAEKSHPERGR